MYNTHLPPIYSLTLDIRMKKGKGFTKLETWMISYYNTPEDIMLKDKAGMSRMMDRMYPNNYKSVKQIIIDKVRTSKIVGRANSNIAHEIR